jgi:integrase
MSIFKVKFDYSISECVCITALLFIILSCRLFFFKAMVQLEVKATQNSRLQSVAARMPAFLSHARANSTVSKYQYEWRRWKSWEFEHFRSHTFPVPLELVLLYLFDRVSVSRSPSSLTSAMYGIRRAHHIAGLLSPTEHLFVKQIVEAAKRLYGKSRQPRKPISVDTLSQIILKFGGPQALLSDLRICFIFLVGFAGFMRCHELIHIQRKHVHVFDTGMEINIPHRKNDQYNHKVYIASSSYDTCPVVITRRYLKVLPQNSEQSLVCWLSYSRHGYVAQKCAISYSRVREILLDSLKLILPDISGYCTRSLKRGAATAAINSGSVTSEQIDLHVG